MPRIRRLCLLAALSLLGSLLLPLAVATPAHAFTIATFNDDYPNPAYEGPGSDPAHSIYCQPAPTGCYTENGELKGWSSPERGFGYRNCTDFVAWKLRQSGITFHGRPFTNDWDNGQAGLGKWGHGKEWAAYAQAIGMAVDHRAAVGAVAQWTTGGGGFGHVALVTHAYSDGRIDVVDYNSNNDGAYHVRPGIAAADNYIHFERPMPGGSWTSVHGDGSVTAGQTLPLAARAEDNGNGGLEHVQITFSTSADGRTWTPWTPWTSGDYPPGTPTANLARDYVMNANCLRVSFDVFSADRSQAPPSRSHQKAPMGVHQYHVGSSSCAALVAENVFVDYDTEPGLGGGTGGQPAANCTAGANQTVLYTEPNYGGDCVVKGIGEYPDPTAIGLPNDSISSLRVGGGANVRLCDNAGLNSPCEYLNHDDPDLADNMIGTNTVSSVKVEGGQPTTGCAPGPEQVALFLDPDYQGLCVVREFGTYNDPSAIGLPNDSISSLKVGSGAKLQACANDGLNSPCEWFDYDDPNLANNSINSEQISSVKAYLRGGISLCEGTNFGGPCQVFADGNTNLADYGWANRARSVLFSGAYNNRYHIVLYTGPNQTGALYHADSHVADLGAPYAGGIQSIKIYPHLPPTAPVEPGPADGAVLPSTTTSTTVAYHVYNQHRLHAWGSDFDVTQDWTDGLFAPLTGLRPGPYFWQVQERNDMGPGPWSAVWSFAVNTPPAVIGTAVSLEENTTQTIQVRAVDAEQPGALTLAGTGLPGFATFTDHHDGTASLALAPGSGTAGSYSIVVSSSDGELTGTGLVTVTVGHPASGDSVFEDFESGLGAWWTHGAVTATVDAGNQFARLVPPSGGDAETSRDVNTAALAGSAGISVALDLHGGFLLGNDASALYLDQGGSWKYVALAGYVQQGRDGWQTVTVPLADFAGFDRTASFNRLGFRFWLPSTGTIDVDQITFLGSTGPAAPAWTGEYFANQDLSGAPALTRTDPALSFDWGDGSPDPAVPADHFSARWTQQSTMDAGAYTFTVTADDGVRVTVDGELVVDRWIDQPPTTYTAGRMLSAGSHTVTVEYYEAGGGAVVRLAIAAASSGFLGQYFSNPDLEGFPALTRTDPAVAFEWGNGSPAPAIPDDYFSARWTRIVDLAAGTYRFSVTGDDGVRLAVDGQIILDKWIDQSPTGYTVDHTLAGGAHTVVFEYYEAEGDATAELSYQPAPTQPNLATGGTAHRWWKNSSATANGNKVAAPALNDGNAVDDLPLRSSGQTEPANAWEAAGVIWASTTTLSAFELNAGSWTASDDGAFTANVRIQITTNGTTWTDATWTSSPAYNLDSPDASGRVYVFTGAPVAVKGIRVTGQVRTPNASSWYANVREIRVY